MARSFLNFFDSEVCRDLKREFPNDYDHTVRGSMTHQFCVR